MINELYQLSRAMDNARISSQGWHQKYNPIPNVQDNAPCVRIVLSNGEVGELSAVSAELGRTLRKYGSNQGTFPCMNLASLYRITDSSIKKALSSIRPEELDADKLAEIRGWCQESNWDDKFRAKYKICMEQMAGELAEKVPGYEPLQILVEDSNKFIDPDVFHQKIENAVWSMLERKEGVSLALAVLFYQGNAQKGGYGSLSVALESERLIDLGMPATSATFVDGLNRSLLATTLPERDESASGMPDAFGTPLDPLGKPISMPKVKLAGGFDVALRTMSKNELCQTRYGRIEDAGYPISQQMRVKLSSSLGWIGGDPNRRDVTWTNTDKNEILFVYPSSFPEVSTSFTKMFNRSKNQEESFKESSKQFIQELRQTKEGDADTHAIGIQVFILRKLDKGRTKIVYTRQTDSHELEKCSEEWTLGCSNLPTFPFGQPTTPFPLDVADTLNRFWKQNGELMKGEFRPVPKYHGMELLMEPDMPVTSDLLMLTGQITTLGAFLGGLLANRKMSYPMWERVKEILALTGLLLYREGIRKDCYMENLPYLYGQLLKASDELHALYCKVVRKDNYPPQLAGGSLFQSAADAPLRTLNLLGQRIMPYYTWAKSYRLKASDVDERDRRRARWLYGICEKTMAKLGESWTPQTRFSDEEKAQLFIGYLAEFPKSGQSENGTEKNDNEEVASNEQ